MRRLHPATVVVSLVPKLREVIQAAAPLIVGSVVSGHHGGGDWIALGIGSFTGLFAIGTYWTTRFEIEPEHVAHKTGWIFRKDRRIPLQQIQNVNLRQNVLERIFRVATVDVETAMGKGRDLKLSVLSLADAEKFREELLGAAHLTNPGSLKVDEPLVRLNRHDLLLGALTENHLFQTFAVLFTCGGYAFALVGKILERFTPTLGAFSAAGVILLLLIGGWIWGTVSYILRYGGFVVRREENVFRISHGLLNRVQLAIRPSRIEFASITVTIPQRLMHRATLKVGTASSFGEAGVLAPVALFVERKVTTNGVADIIPGLDIPSLLWQPFDPMFYRSHVVRSMFWLAATGAAGFAMATVGQASALTLAVVWGMYAGLVLLRLAALFLARPENGFAVTEEAVVVRQGYFHQSISAIPIERVENIAVNQPLWWKRFRASRLMVQAMKHRLHVGAVPDSSVEELMVRWRGAIEAREIREELKELELTMAAPDQLSEQSLPDAPVENVT